MSWAIVIGIDRYSGDVPSLAGAVADARSFYRWVTSSSGGNVPQSQTYRLYAPATDESQTEESDNGLGSDPSDPAKAIVEPTKDNVMAAVNDLMRASKGGDERLFFYFSGHGLTVSYANREESALAMSGFDEEHADQTLAVRSITEFFETTQFQDQFFFIDACRNKPKLHVDPIGRWSIPRTRDPGQPPVQQFILYATSPGRRATEAGVWPGEAEGAFSSVLMHGLSGQGRAKAWSWERNCYEVRWEALATYVKNQMERRREGLPEDARSNIQVPQDTGSRGVVDRERDARLTIISRRAVSQVAFDIDLGAPLDEPIDLWVLDATAGEVESESGLTASPHTLTLLPRTYAISAKTATRRGRLAVPLDLSDDSDEELQKPIHEIEWRTDEDEEEDLESGEGDASIELRSQDPLAVAEITDEAGHFFGVAIPGVRRDELAPGFYRVRTVGPAPADLGEQQLLHLEAGRTQSVNLQPATPKQQAATLAEAFGGHVDGHFVVPVADAEPVAWAQPSTVLAAAVGARIHGDEKVLAALDVDASPEIGADSGIAVYAVAGDDNPEALDALRVRVWPAGQPIPKTADALPRSNANVATLVCEANPLPHWLAFELGDQTPTVLALSMLRGRLATVIAEVDSETLRLYQFHPRLTPSESSTPGRLRRVEQLQRSLLGGRLRSAEALARDVAAKAGDDPFAGCIAGYVLLRLGGHQEELGELASAIIAAAPQLSDAFILRGEYEAYRQNREAADQAFADAAAAGVPAFGEGLTRLVEGLRVSGMSHPRASLVRYIFQQHARGSMWAAFTPRYEFKPDRFVITGVDLGYEG
jgi:uncharacterized caspase-like protein